MAIRMMSGLTQRIVTVLQDYLPAELALIDAEEADGITTPDIAAGAYFQWDRQNITEYPACSLRVVSSTPIGDLGVRPDTFGSRVDALHRVDVLFHVTLVIDGSDHMTLQTLLLRYVTGAMRVLCIQKVGLATVADPTDFVMWTTWAEPATYGPEVDQEDGAIVRTATLPIAARRIDLR